MRRLVIALAALALLLLAADRVGVRLAQQAIADRMRTSAGLTSTPTVSIKGFPFLTQALRGRYAEIAVTAGDLQREGVRVATLEATLRGVQVPLGDALRGDVSAIPVDELLGTAVVTYADLAHRSRLVGLRIEPTGDVVHVTARVTVLGQTVTATSISAVSLNGRTIVITARSLKVLGVSSPAVLNALSGRLDLRVPVATLPYDLELTGLAVTPEGVRLSARSGPTVLSTRAG